MNETEKKAEQIIGENTVLVNEDELAGMLKKPAKQVPDDADFMMTVVEDKPKKGFIGRFLDGVCEELESD